MRRCRRREFFLRIPWVAKRKINARSISGRFRAFKRFLRIHAAHGFVGAVRRYAVRSDAIAGREGAVLAIERDGSPVGRFFEYVGSRIPSDSARANQRRICDPRMLVFLESAKTFVGSDAALHPFILVPSGGVRYGRIVDAEVRDFRHTRGAGFRRKRRNAGIQVVQVVDHPLHHGRSERHSGSRVVPVEIRPCRVSHGKDACRRKEDDGRKNRATKAFHGAYGLRSADCTAERVRNQVLLRSLVHGDVRKSVGFLVLFAGDVGKRNLSRI